MNDARSSRQRLADEVLASVAVLAREATAHFPMAGGVVSLADRDGLLGEVAFGSADLAAGTPMSTSHLFEIGSISKVFTSLVVNRLVEQGVVSLDESIAGLLPDWLRSPSFDDSMTLERLLNHTAGVVVGGDGLPDDAGEARNLRDCPVAPNPPLRFHYSNYGYLLAGEIIRHRTRRRLSDHVRDDWFGPLAMSGALAEVGHADRSRLATGYWPARPDRPWTPGDPIEPATWFEIDSASGNIAATAADMARLVAALIGAANADPVRGPSGEVVLGPDTFERMISRLAPSGEPTYVPEGFAGATTSRYGLGINVERIDGHLCVSHGGGMVGYSTFMLVDCTSQVGAVVMTNANGDTLASHMLARVLHGQFLRAEAGEAPVTVRLDPSVRTAPGPRGPLESPGLGHFVARNDGRALDLLAARPGEPVRVRYGDVEAHLYRRGNGRYVTDHPALRTFHLDWHDDGDLVGWTHGSATFVAAGDVATGASNSGERNAHPLVGHFRSFSPWYPELRILERDGRLLLTAPGGVEAHDEEVELVALDDGTYRIGADPWFPERLVPGPDRGGEIVSVVRDGCTYTRVFSA